MTVLKLSFPAGRYHATPWGRHVNEGAVEWPPSPWRILRSLIATWYLKAHEEISESVMHDLIGALSQPPSFQLPPATTSHTRHYMPYIEGKNEKTTKVFDTFIQIAENDAIYVNWNVEFPPEQLEALKLLVDRLGYFGRAESLVEARVLDDSAKFVANAELLSEGSPLPKETELVRLLASMVPDEYQNWRDEFLKTNAPDEPPANNAKKAGKKSKKSKALEVPENLFRALEADTGKLQSAGWNLPPGALYMNYTRLENAFASTAKPRVRQNEKLLTVARYAVVSEVAPSITQAVSIAGRVHDALCKWSDQGNGASAVFTGLDANGEPRRDHQHAHIFCEANGERDAITHITVWAEMGFDEAACDALRRIRKVWGYGGHDIQLVLYGIGQPDNFTDCTLFRLNNEERKSKVWRSLTPFVSARHEKTFRDGRPKMDSNGWQIGSSGHDLLRLLALHPQGADAKINLLPERSRPFQFGSRNLCSLQFQTIRKNGEGRRGNDSGNAFKITFPKPVSGPIALGYGAHFGLGLFVPEKSDEA